MAETNNGNNRTPFKDNDGNEITHGQKVFAGILLVLLTLFGALYLIAHWPDRLPLPDENIKPLYSYSWFHVRLKNITDSGRLRYVKPGAVAEKTGPVDILKSKTDSASNSNKKDTLADSATGSLSKNEVLLISGVSTGRDKESEDGMMHLNTLLLILVAIGGFLGNMIYVSTSFTTFIGSGKFKKSWVLWYCVKPFTAALLAIAIYFVFRGGFLNMSDNTTNINLYGVMTISILAGLFTDRTTLKLKEVFDVLLRPKEERPDQLENTSTVLGVQPETIVPGTPAVITLTGESLDNTKIEIAIEGLAVENLERKPTEIKFSYTLPDALKDKESVTMTVRNLKNGTSTYTLKIQQPVPPASDAQPQSGENYKVPRGGAGGDITGPADIVPDADELDLENQTIVKE